ncbi:MAG: 16S rRNA (guanine(527)-N(7))-methyltransferase RsmG [Culicoidibacterales bacterium]
MITMFEEELAKQNILLSSRMKEQLNLYFQILVEKNKVMNLTGITDEEGVYWKHFYDSATVLFNDDLKHKTLCDVGSGAGFPGVVLAILEPTLQVTIVDSLNKRILFLKELVAELGLNNVVCISARAEELAKDAKYREQFDVVTARAVARLPMLLELCSGFVKHAGMFIAMKSMQADDELNESKDAIRLLGFKHEKTITLELPVFLEHRVIYAFSKVTVLSQKYPRVFGQIKNKPL